MKHYVKLYYLFNKCRDSNNNFYIKQINIVTVFYKVDGILISHILKSES